MLFFLFSEDELRRLFERLGYEYAPDTARKTIDYYDRRTSHGSTLSFVAHAGVLAAIDPESSWERFLRGAGERRRRHPGRHDAGGHPPGRDVRNAGPHPARLPRRRDPRRRRLLRSEADGPARRAVVPDAVPPHADQGDARGRASSRSRPSPTASARRSGSASARTSGSWARATAARSRSPIVGRRADALGGSGACGRAFAARSSTWTACSSTRRTSALGARCRGMIAQPTQVRAPRWPLRRDRRSP